MIKVAPGIMMADSARIWPKPVPKKKPVASKSTVKPEVPATTYTPPMPG